MTRLSSLAFSLFLFVTPAMACLEDVQGDQQADGQAFVETVRALNNDSFVESYCALGSDDQDLARRLFASAYKKYEGDDRATLARLSIMIPDIRENVAFVVSSGEIREVDEEWESIGIMRLIEAMRARFPETKFVLSDSYVGEIKALFDAALEAVAARETRSDDAIIVAHQAIAEHERKIKELQGQIQALRDERLKYRSMRQELELQVR